MVVVRCDNVKSELQIQKIPQPKSEAHDLRQLLGASHLIALRAHRHPASDVLDSCIFISRDIHL